MDKFKNMKFGQSSSNKNSFSQLFGKIDSLKSDLKSGVLNPTRDFSNSKNMKLNVKSKKLSGTVSKILISFATVLVVFSLFLYFVVISPLLSFRDSVLSLSKTSEKLSTELISNRDLVEYEKNLFKLENDLKNLRNVRDSKIGHLKNFPYIKDFYPDIEVFISSGLKVVDAGKEVRKIIEPFADAIGIKISEDKPVAKVGFADAVATWITVMPKVASNLDPVIIKLDEAGEELKKVDARKYNINILGLYKNDLSPAIIFAQRTLSEAREYGPDASQALLIFPKLLGVGTGEQRYMIIMQNDAEIRATGGFWTNFATFKVKNALLTSDFTSKDMYSIDITLDAIDAVVTFPTVPEAYKDFLKVERMYARDANISPDFPTAISQFNTPFYRYAMQINPEEYKPVNGYIAINTEVVREFIAITGAVTVNGVTFDENNVVLELEKIASLSLAQQANRKKVLGDLMEAMLKNVFESDSFLWSKLIDKGVDLMNRKQIFVYLNDPEAQKLVEKYNYGGRIVDQGNSDYMFFVSTNLGGDKTNMFTDRSYVSETALDNGRILRTVKVTYTYTEPKPEYIDFRKRYQDWFRLYVPEGSELVSLTGNDTDKVYTDKERGKVYFGGFLTLGPGETKTVEYKYYLPSTYKPNNEYNLYIQKQSGVNVENYQFNVFGNKMTTLDKNGKESNIFKIDTDYKLNVSSK
jgi:hypothetical protein